jgi:hypothetical protein
MSKRLPTETLFNQYKEKCLSVLNKSLAWNIAKLPHNTFDLQLAKYCEEIDEAIEAEAVGYQEQIMELADVLIAIGGMARFDELLSKEMFDGFIGCVDKYIFMDVVDYAEKKIPILYEREYKDGYHH